MKNDNLNPQQQQDSPQMQALIERARNNKSTVIMLCILVVLIIFGLILYFFISNSNSAKADEAVGRADAAYAQNDSIALQLYKEAADMGHKGGNRAAAMAAINLYQAGEYQQALDYLNDCSLDDQVAATGVYSLMGDCYVNLGQYPQALNAFDKAVKKADGNPMLVPVVLIKKANVYRAQENYQAEFETLQNLVDNYPQFVEESQTDIRKYFERAKAACGK